MKISDANISLMKYIDCIRSFVKGVFLADDKKRAESGYGTCGARLIANVKAHQYVQQDFSIVVHPPQQATAEDGRFFEMTKETVTLAKRLCRNARYVILRSRRRRRISFFHLLLR
jgi:hypothetical protein